MYVGIYALHTATCISNNIVGSKHKARRQDHKAAKVKYFVCLSKFQNHVIERDFIEMTGH